MSKKAIQIDSVHSAWQRVTPIASSLGVSADGNIRGHDSVNEDGHQTSKYSVVEEVWHTLTHGLGAMLGVIALVFMVAKASMSDHPDTVFAVSVFGAGMITMFMASTLYHGSFRSRFQPFFRMLDHSAIYIMIAGSYTPFALVILPPETGYPLMVIVWTVAALGVGFKAVMYILKRQNQLEWISLTTYLGLGWAAVVVVSALYELLPGSGFGWLVAGGLCYTLGAVIYAIERIPFGHTIWHVMVMAGASCHFVSVYAYVV